MNRSLVTSLWLLCTSPLVMTWAQVPTRDVAGTAAPSQSGTGRIAGVVVGTDVSATPMRRVIVTLSGAELRGGRTAISDDDGRFVFDGLPDGRFTLSGTKPGYLPAAYGSPKPGRPGVPLQITVGQQLTSIRLTMAHGASISGTLHDPAGEPVENMQVHAFRLPLAGAAPILALSGSATTDDRGVYRVYGLPPGDYLIASAIRVGGLGNSDVTALSAAQIDQAFRELQQQQRGESVVPAATPRVTAASETVAFAPVFYPGVPSTSGATPITLGLGDDRGDVDLTVRLTRMATIQGSVSASDGTLPATQFVINVEGLQLPPLIGAIPTYSSQTGPSGKTFKYTNVAPGRYRILAQATSPVVTWARADVEVTGDDIPGVSLVLQPALKMSGRMVFDGAVLKQPDVSAVRVNLTATNGLGSSSAGSTRMGNFLVPPAVVKPDGTFEIGGIVPDTYRIATTVPGATGWWLRSAIVNGRDVLDYPFEIGATDISGAILTFSDRHTTLSGRVELVSGQPASAYFVAVFPADRALWRPQSRRIQLVRADADGTWIVTDLPPGDYLLAVLTDVDTVAALDARVLDTLTGFAAKVTLADGEQKTQHLRIGG